MNYIEMTEYLHNKLADRYADNVDGFKKLYQQFERQSDWSGIRKHENSDMEIFGIYEHGMRLNLRLNSKYQYEHQRWIDRFADAGLNAYRDPNGQYWLLVPITKRNLESSDKLDVILACMNTRYQKLKNKF